jgi:outer membrane biosynthesis protein TonB
MASTERIFFAGVATTVLLIGAGFGGGVLLGKAAVDAPQKLTQTVASLDSLPPPAKVILPDMAAAAATAPAVQLAAAIPNTPPQAKTEPAPEVISVKDVSKKESEKKVARQTESEKQRAAKNAAERERHKRNAAQKAMLESERKQQAQQYQVEQQQEALRQSQRPSLLSFDREDGPPQRVSFFEIKR